LIPYYDPCCPREFVDQVFVESRELAQFDGAVQSPRNLAAARFPTESTSRASAWHLHHEIFSGSPARFFQKR
jgi:hypothetical protein